MKHFFLISSNPELFKLFKDIYPQAQWSVSERGAGAIEYLFNDPPELLIVDNDLDDLKGLELIRLFKSENVYRQVPAIICLNQDDLLHDIDFAHLEADDFLLKPIEKNIALARLNLTMARAARALDANPLTKLPATHPLSIKFKILLIAKKILH